MNARLDDQLMRNHATQYVSMPDYGWERLRKETPGLYESYTDLGPGGAIALWSHTTTDAYFASLRADSIRR